MKNQLTIFGGGLIIVSMFLPAVTMLGFSVSFLSNSKGVGFFWILCGITILVAGVLNKRKLNIVSLILGLLVTGIAAKYYNDAMGGAGLGILAMLAGGILTLLGSFKSLKEK